MAEQQQAMVCVGQIATAHGVRGLVKLRSFTADPAAIADYGPLSDQAGTRRFAIRLVGEAKDQLIAAVEGVEDREAAMALRGARLYVPRSRLPAPEDEEEFYLVDLIGLEVITVDGEPFGRVTAIEDYGAGEVVEIARPGAPGVAAPFTRACFPTVDLKAGSMVIDPPEGLFDEPAAGDARRHG
jgi:16S rRNA processing protein RimM